jgi:hypothetical protein
MIRYSMNGEDLGEVTEEKVHELLSGGKIDHSAFFWREGMLEWRPIAELLGKLEIAGELEQKSGKPPMKPTKNEPTKTQIKFLIARGVSVNDLTRVDAERLVAKHKTDETKKAELEKAEYASARNTPTDWQLVFLDYHRVKFGNNLTKQEASQLIEETKNKNQNSDWSQVNQILYPNCYGDSNELETKAKQLAFLEYHGIKYGTNITTREAASLIGEALTKFSDSKWNRVKHILYPKLYEYSTEEATLLRELQSAIKTLDDAKNNLQELKQHHKKSKESISQEDLAEASELVENSKNAVNEAKNNIKDSKQDNEDYLAGWIEDFGLGLFKNTNEDIDDYLSTFKKPTKSQIKSICEKFENHYKLNFDSVTAGEFFLVYSKMFGPDCFKKGKTATFSVSDIVISPTYTGAHKTSNSGSKKSIKAPKKRGCISRLVRLFLLVIGLLIALSVIAALVK